jgi:hypothetical protein
MMQKQLISLLILLCTFPAAAQVRSARRTVGPRPVPAAASNEVSALPIKRLILYSNGVAYIERRGFVSGNAEVNLSFKQSQVDDVLKSMIVLDLGQGKIGAVSYNSSAPASARTAEIPFSIDPETKEDGGIAAVLGQMQGAKVLVTANKGAATGSILTVENRVVPADKERSAAVAHFLVIASESGDISSFDLAEVRSVKLLDDGTKHDLNEFANATASTRRRDAKTIVVTSNGSGQRELVVSYTIAAPIWKTTYRVVLDKEGKPFFQGWAIVDNVSDEDWTNIKLSLVSGSPVSFIQNLQKPLYRYRPIIPIPDDLNLDPQVYDAENGTGRGSGDGSASGTGSGSGNGSGFGNGNGASATVDVASNEMRIETSVSDALTSENSGVSTAATGKVLGDLFEYTIENAVTVPRNRSALIPIVQTKMDGERVSIYNEEARKDRPMGGMMLTNTTTLTFEGGSLTVLDNDAYAGEALMERLKPQERRLVSFALDLGTRVSAQEKHGREAVKLVKVVNGVFQVHYFKTDEKIYHVTNQTDKEKVIYIEHPVRKNWMLAGTTQKPDVVTDRYYRFRVELKPFAEADLPVAESQGLMDSFQLAAVSRDELDLFLTRRLIDDATRAKLEKLLDLRLKIAQLDNSMKLHDDEAQKIESDQKRLRENIEALSKTAEAKILITRYIAKANDQETRMEELEKERKALEAQKQQLASELATEIRNFEIK